jgi:two-component system cell cycle response regulator DivK
MQQTAERPGRGRLVLVVEDNDRSRRLTCDLLCIHGFEVVETDTGEAALDLARRCRPVLALLDIQLPGIDGTEVLTALRADADLRHIPAVAVTAFAMHGDEERLLGLGFDAYISKPIDTRAFVPRLVALLDDRAC